MRKNSRVLCIVSLRMGLLSILTFRRMMKVEKCLPTRSMMEESLFKLGQRS
jgi:hypothetical protein